MFIDLIVCSSNVQKKIDILQFFKLKLLCLIMASPITPFVGVKAFMGMPIEQLEINRSPVESIFHFITVFNASSREGAHQIGLNRDALRQNLTFAGMQAGKGLQLAATGFNYLLTILQNTQAGNNQNPSLQHAHQTGKRSQKHFEISGILIA